MHLRTLRLDKTRLEAYQAAAERQRRTRQDWILAVLDTAAAQRLRPPDWSAGCSSQPTHISAIRRLSTTIDTDVGGNGEARRTAWDSAAAVTGLSPAQWAVVVLDAAAGISELPAQLRRVV